MTQYADLQEAVETYLRRELFTLDQKQLDDRIKLYAEDYLKQVEANTSPEMGPAIDDLLEKLGRRLKELLCENGRPRKPYLVLFSILRGTIGADAATTGQEIPVNDDIKLALVIIASALQLELPDQAILTSQPLLLLLLLTEIAAAGLDCYCATGSYP